MQRTIQLAAVLLILNIAGILNAAPPDIVWEIEAYTSSVRDLSYAADGQSIATVSGLSDRPVILWSAVDGSLMQSIDFYSTGALSVDLASDGQNLAAGYIVSGYPPGSLTNVWNLSGPTLINEFGGAYAAFSPDGSLIASGGGSVSSYLRVYEVSTGNNLYSVYTGSYITALAYSSTGDVIATGGSTNIVKLWDAATGNMLYELTGHTDNISSLAFSHDGTILASAEGGFDVGGQSFIKLWSVTSGTLLRTLDGHGEWVHDVDFSPDDQYLISSGREAGPNLVQKIKIWRLSDGQLAQEYDAAAYCVEYSPDGQYFAYGSPYGELTLALNPFTGSSSSLNIDLTYLYGSPVPATGGDLHFGIYVENTGAYALTFDAWIDIAYEGGNPMTVIQRTLNNFQPGWTIDRPNTFFPVPASYAAGNYTFTGRLGDHPDNVWVEDGFAFEKSGNNFLAGFEPFRVAGAPDPFAGLTDDSTVEPAQFALLGNYPNPFNPTTTIRYNLAEAAKVTLAVYDVQGRQVAELVDGVRDAGIHEVTFDASPLASGVYLYRIDTDSHSAIGKMMLVK